MSGGRGDEWTQVVKTAKGFGKKHGHWPTRMVLPDRTHDAVRALLGEEAWGRFEQGVEVRAGAARPRAEDAGGESYIWGESLATRLTFTVADPEPDWFSLTPRNPDEPPDPLADALERLGYSADATHADGNPVVSIERAVSRAGSAAIRALRQADPPAKPGTGVGPLLELLRVPRVREVMSAVAFRRIQRAVLRVYAAEFNTYLNSDRDEGDRELDSLATSLGEALQHRPLPTDTLRTLETRASEVATTDVGQDLQKLLRWAIAVAEDEEWLAPLDTGGDAASPAEADGQGADGSGAEANAQAAEGDATGNDTAEDDAPDTDAPEPSLEGPDAEEPLPNE